jgi:3'-phosphoadenosine 5'-phosphosulfate sulfotransferase (PAPS reductase)/FAD synthetase
MSAKATVTVESVDLRNYDVIVVSTSGGKDSQAMLDYLVELATSQGVRDRLVAVHADLGKVEWDGAKDIASQQVANYGMPFIVISRTGTVSNGAITWTKNPRSGAASCHGAPLYAEGEVRGDLLDQVKHRAAQLRSQGKAPLSWYSAAARYCTADHKRGPIGTVFTAIAKQWQAENGSDSPCRILDCQGLRAEEGAARAKKENFKVRTSTKSQHVETWLPIQAWTTVDVWNRIEAAGTPAHWAYRIGMPRLSCCFCCYATKDGLLLAGKYNRQLLSEYVAVEKETGFSFKADLRLADVEAQLESGYEPNPLEMADWSDGGCSG